MKLLDTIPIYENPDWLIATIVISLATFILTIRFGSNESFKTMLITAISMTILIISLIIGFAGIAKIHTHDEYIVTINEISASEFFKDYEMVKTFPYSDAIQVRKKDGVK